jgi:hypothetical protein
MASLRRIRIMPLALACALSLSALIAGAGTSPAAERESVTLLDLSGSGSKTTETFRVSGEWDLQWSYDCANFGQAGILQVYIESKGALLPTVGVNQTGTRGRGTEHYHTAGTYYLEVNSVCAWTMKVVDRPIAGTRPPPQPTARPRAERVMLQLRGSGTKSTETFKVGDQWDLQWTYDCASFGQAGIFQVYIQSKTDPLAALIDVNQSGNSGQGVEHYHKAGTMYLQVNSVCDWTIKVLDRS